MNVNDKNICISLIKGKILVYLHYIFFLRTVVFLHMKLMVRKKVGNFFTCKMLIFSGETTSLSPKVKLPKGVSLNGEETASKYKIWNATFKRKPWKYLRGRGKNCVYPSFSFTPCPAVLRCRCAPLQCPKTIQNLDVHATIAQQRTQ